MAKSQRVIVIGAGFAGLAAASMLAKDGYKVTVLEKNDQTGGRARIWQKDGYTFDMGPSWYWMPDVFEEFFSIFGKKTADFYELKRLDPSYRIYFGEGDTMDIPASMQELEALFEKEEPGSSVRLKKFMEQAAYKYKVGMKDYVFRPSHSITEFIDFRLIRESLRIQMLSSLSKHVRKNFSNPRLVKLLEFPVLFLGATPQKTPAMYSMMNYADLALGTWYPMGGMNQIVRAMTKIAEDQGVEFVLNTEVEQIEVDRDRQQARLIHTNNGTFEADILVANSDYRHTDQVLLEKPWRTYNHEYWENRVMSPSSLLFYIGVEKKLSSILHHNLFFDEDFELHAREIYTQPAWPTKPLFYVSATTHTDPSGAPKGCENLFMLVPLAPGLEDSEERREQYFDVLLNRFERLTGESLRDSIAFKRSYAMKDFEKDYHSFKGNAYGLANTLMQTAFFKPKLKSKRVKNLYYTGQLTVPGPGVPPSLISGQVVASEIAKDFR
ncbi:MAG: phytoene desaturase family protein [Bacteroidota bacterium]